VDSAPKYRHHRREIPAGKSYSVSAKGPHTIEGTKAKARAATKDIGRFHAARSEM